MLVIDSGCTLTGKRVFIETDTNDEQCNRHLFNKMKNVAAKLNTSLGKNITKPLEFNCEVYEITGELVG